jgi:hypothetical protein
MREPVALTNAIANLLKAGVALAAVLWPDLSPEAQIAIIGFGMAGISVVEAYIARAAVTPVSAPVLAVDTAVTTPTGEPAIVRAPIGV